MYSDYFYVDFIQGKVIIEVNSETEINWNKWYHIIKKNFSQDIKFLPDYPNKLTQSEFNFLKKTGGTKIYTLNDSNIQ